jgi:hypothetical protein
MSTAIHEKLKKLIAHEQSARNIGSLSEAEIFAAKIQEMLLTHKLSLDEIELEAEEHNEPIGEEYVHADDTDHLYRDHSQAKMGPLANVIANAFFCRVIYHGTSIVFIGRETNRRAVIDLYKLLVAICVRSFPDDLKVYKKSVRFQFDYGSARQKEIAFKNGYFIGFTRTIQMRFLAQQKQTALPSGEKGLVLIKKMDTDIENHMSSLSLRQKKSTGLSINNAGMSAGDNRARDVSLTSKALL